MIWMGDEPFDNWFRKLTGGKRDDAREKEKEEKIIDQPQPKPTRRRKDGAREEKEEEKVI